MDKLSTDFAGDGTLPGFGGIIPSDPSLPGAVITNPDGSLSFDASLLPVANGPGVNPPIFIDPDVAVGYDDRITSGRRFAAVVVPGALPDGDAELRLVGAGHADQVPMAGVGFDLLSLDPSGVDAFSILDIDTGEALYPTNTFAFVTGLRFVSAGSVSLTQSPVVTFVSTGGSVPEPTSWMLAVLSLVLLRGMRPSRPSRARRD